MLATSSPTIRLSAAARPDPLLLTKLTPPPIRANPIARPRLTDALAHGASGPLTVICAPAGYGKTTLLSAWAHQRAAPTAWLSLDRNDNDPARFWAYVIAALRSVVPDCGADALALIGSPQPPPPTTALTLLLNDLASCAGTYVLVLDDYHLIDNPAIHQALGFVLEHRPSNLHLILAGRSLPALPLARLRARGQLVELRAADLRCTRAEATVLLRDHIQLALPSDALTMLASRTEGWLAGLHLAALAVQGAADGLGVVHALSGTQEMIRDYLIDEVFDQQPHAIQQFLLQTAILERLNAPLCDALRNGSAPARSSDSQRVLTYLERANLFLAPLDEQRRWYRYHPLFAEALRARLAQTQPAQVADLHRRAAAWYAAEGLEAEAVGHALAGDPAQAARLVAQVADRLWLRGEVTTLLGWLDGLPKELVRTQPKLALAHAWTLLAVGALERIEPVLSDAERALRAAAELAPKAPAPVNSSPTPTAALGAIAILRAIVAAIQDADPQQLGEAHQALACLPIAPDAWGAMTALNLGFAAWTQGALAQARDAFRQAIALGRAIEDRYTELLATAFLADVQTRQGHLPLALATYTDALSLVDALSGRRSPLVSYVAIGMGRLHYEWNALAEALCELPEGIEQATQGGTLDAMLTGHIQYALAQQASGDPAGACATMHRAAQLARRSGMTLMVGYVEAAQARVWLMQGEQAAAAGWVRARGLGVEDPISFLRENEYLVLARLLIARGAQAEARRLLMRLGQGAASAGRVGVVIEALVLTALASQVGGETEPALAALQEALALAEPGGYVRTFVDLGAPMRWLIAECRVRLARRARGATNHDLRRLLEYIDTLLAAFGDAALRSAPATQQPIADLQSTVVEQLTQRELEILRCVAAGMPTAAIATRCTVAASTVNWHLQNAYAKLGVRSRTQALARARELGLLP